MKSITASALRALQSSSKDLLIDVREQDEYEASHVTDVPLFPLSTLSDSLEALQGYETVYVHCRSGRRSSEACVILEKAGINAVNVEGGIIAMEEAGFPIVTG